MLGVSNFISDKDIIIPGVSHLHIWARLTRGDLEPLTKQKINMLK